MTISIKWCPICEIAWQTTRKRCWFCRHLFVEDDEYTTTRGEALRRRPKGGRHATDA